MIADAEDAARLAHAEAGVLALRIKALAAIPLHLLLPSHRRFVASIATVPATALSAAQEDHVLRLCWTYRSRIGAHLAPRCNPDDPIAMQFRHEERTRAAGS